MPHTTRIDVPADLVDPVISALDNVTELDDRLFPLSTRIDEVDEVSSMTRKELGRLHDAVEALDELLPSDPATVRVDEVDELTETIMQQRKQINDALDAAMHWINQLVPLFREPSNESEELYETVQRFYALVDQLNYYIFDMGKSVSHMLSTLPDASSRR